jgi:hypothetical protein
VAWYLNNALTTMRNEVNARWPGRDKGSDGTIGDEAHQSTSSDHNPDPDGSVDAWDMDVNLNGAGNGIPSDDIEFLKARFQAHESSKYWIHNRIICSRSTGWRRENYTGSNPHDKHVHWNTRSEYEDSTKPWGIEDDMAEFTQENFNTFFANSLENATVQARLRREVVSYMMTSDPAYNLLSLYTMLKAKVPNIETQLTQVLAALTATEGDTDLVAIQNMLNEQTAEIASDVRDAVADLGEGGSVKVRGPQD